MCLRFLWLVLIGLIENRHSMTWFDCMIALMKIRINFDGKAHQTHVYPLLEEFRRDRKKNSLKANQEANNFRSRRRVQTKGSQFRAIFISLQHPLCISSDTLGTIIVFAIFNVNLMSSKCPRKYNSFHRSRNANPFFNIFSVYTIFYPFSAFRQMAFFWTKMLQLIQFLYKNTPRSRTEQKILWMSWKYIKRVEIKIYEIIVGRRDMDLVKVIFYVKPQQLKLHFLKISYLLSAVQQTYSVIK